MKFRFGIREKFALIAIVLVFAAAWFAPTFLFQQTRHIVEEHELVDLQDEADLRCWQFVDLVNLLRAHVNEASRNPEALKSLISYLKEKPDKTAPEAGSDRGPPAWWDLIVAVKQLKDDGTAQSLYEIHMPEGTHLPDPPSDWLARARANQGIPFVSPMLAADLPVDRQPGSRDDTMTEKGPGKDSDPSAGRLQRTPVIWGSKRVEGSDAQLCILLSLEQGRSARHLSILMDAQGDFLMHPSNTGHYDQTFGKFSILDTKNDIEEGRKWRGEESNAQTQRGPLFQKVRLDTPVWFLEGRVTDEFQAKMAELEDKDRYALDSWTTDLRRRCEEKGWHFSSATAQFREVRLLALDRTKLENARSTVMETYRKKLGEDVGSGVDWSVPVACEHGDIQMIKFYLRLSPLEAGAPDPPYYFVYAAFREELASGIEHEMDHLRKAAAWLALCGGVGAFFIALFFVRPLTRITGTAQQVSAADDTQLQLQHQIEAVRESLPTRRSDEVGDIARALESLLRQVLNGHERLRQLNADLEDRVVSRTKELSEANEALKGLASAKDAFLASVSHELRQPLNSIFGFLQFLEFSNLDTEQRQDVGKVRNAATYLRRLIDDILDYQKIIMGGMDLEPDEFDSAEFFSNLQDSMQPQAADRNNKLVFEGTNNLGVLRNDRQRLQQIMVNLLSNACKFTDQGTVTLRASRETDSLGRDWISIAVSDTGRGMTPKEQGDLFVQFKKLSAKEGNKTGTGLGLVICRGLAKLMNGDISVHSEYGKGTTFTVHIPARVGEVGDSPAPEAVDLPLVVVTSGEGVPSTAPPGNAPLVLVIDDDPAVRELMARFLGTKGFRTITAEDGITGIETARREKPSVITLDVVLPGASGWDVLTTLKHDPATADIPVIMVTFLEDTRRGVALGAADYLVKPIDWTVLQRSLQRLLTHGEPVGPVLVVDDDEGTRELYRRTLAQNNWEVAEAENGAEAIAWLEKNRPSAMLLDLMMPVMDGFECLAEMDRHPEWSDIPVFIVTAKDPTAAERQFLDGKAEVILRKGNFQQSQLLEEILRHVVRHTSV